MTNPPPPGNWGPPQPPYGQGQPPYGPGQWPPQQGWGQPPQPPKNNNLKWLLIGVAVLLVIAISVGATLLFTRDGGGGTTQTANGNPPAAGEIASANDTGPVSVITEDPSCGPSRPVLDTLSREESQGWESRDPGLSASSWSPDERMMHEKVADAMRRAADQSVAFAKLTPHRVMRELYEQSIAYWRAYADSIPTYTPADNELARVATASSSAIVAICAAVNNQAAATRGPLVAPAMPPSSPESVADPSDPSQIMSSKPNAQCKNWRDTLNQFDIDAAPWFALDANIPASQWTADQRSSMDAMGSVMSRYASELEDLGRNSGDAVFEDFASLAAQYWRAFVAAIPSYTTADSYLSSAASSTGFVLYNACAYSKEK